MSSRVIESKNIYDAGFHEFYTYGTGALASNIGLFNSIQTMTIKNGNVGIGTANPTQKLHIEGNIFAKGNVTCSNISVIGDFVTLNTITSNTEQVVIENAGTGPALKVTQTGNNSVAEFYDNESGLAMIVGNNGNIGIGTNMPMAKLDVKGIIKNTNPCFYAYRIGAVAPTAFTTSGGVIPLNATEINVQNCYNISDYTFTAPINGIYKFGITALHRGGSSGSTAELTIEKRLAGTSTWINNGNQNTTTSRRSLAYSYTFTSPGHTTVYGSAIRELNAGDSIRPVLQALVTSGDIYIGEGFTYFEGYLLS